MSGIDSIFTSHKQRGRPRQLIAFTGRPGAPTRKEFVMSWSLLVIAGLFEVGWAVGLKYTQGFTRLWPTVGTVAAMAVSTGLLGWAIRTLPVETAYAVWTGIGAVGTVLLGIVLFGEPATAARLACVALILAGIVGLKLTA
jgi:quaternary ammonium compound-resistance protein SugE